MKARFLFLCALAAAATACLQDSEAPNNLPSEPTVTVDPASVTRVSLLVNGTFGMDMTDISDYGVEISDVLFETGGTPRRFGMDQVTLTPEGYSLGITGLKSNNTYFLRSYVSNGFSKMYSPILTHKTPETSVASVSDVTLKDGYNLTATIEDNGGRVVEEAGFIWSESEELKAIRRAKRFPATLSADGKTFTLPKSEVGAGTHYILAYVEDDESGTGFGLRPFRLDLQNDDEVEIQDAQFKAYLLAHFDRDQNGKISYGELKVIKALETGTDAIASVREIESMSELSSIRLAGSEPRKGKLTALPVKQNRKLRSLDCSNNQLASLSLTDNILLETLNCSGNALKELSVENNVRLDRLDCSNNQLQALDLSNNSGVRFLDISGNKLGKTDLSGLIALKELNCENNPQMDTLFLSIDQQFDVFRVPSGTVIKYVDEPVISASHYLTFSSEGTTRLTLSNSGGNAPVLYYSRDAKAWTSWDYSELSFTKGSPLYLCGDNPEGFSVLGATDKISCFVSPGDRYSVSGDIMSLINKDKDVSVIPSPGCFNRLFADCTGLTSAPELTATTLTYGCYWDMFSNCTALTAAPELPATHLAERCYGWMFSGCSSLTTPPSRLPATKLFKECYRGMFFRCSSLTSAPELPATTMAESCYEGMFYECSSLKQTPDLPADQLAESCYRGMFWNSPGLVTASALPATIMKESCYHSMYSYCTGLTTAPDLPAAVLADSCYYRVFDGCVNLNKLKCLATDISAPGCVDFWLAGVPSTGSFVKAASMNDWPSGSGGIPTGWAAVNEGEVPGGGNEGTGEEGWN